jgi:hypothetical protein
MKRPVHGKFFNFAFGIVMFLILTVFGLGFYLLISNVFNVRPGGNVNPTTIVLVIGGGITLLALITGLLYLVAQVDTYQAKKHYEQDEDDHYQYN